MTDLRIISYVCSDPAERASLQHLAMLHVDRTTENGSPTADVVMPFYGKTAEAARSHAETWFADEQAAAAAKRANIAAAADKRAEARKLKVPA